MMVAPRIVQWRLMSPTRRFAQSGLMPPTGIKIRDVANGPQIKHQAGHTWADRPQGTGPTGRTGRHA